MWGGDAEHEHKWGLSRLRPAGNAPSAKSTLTTNNGRGPQSGDKYQHENAALASTGSFCPCGAWLGSLGLEPTPELFVAHIIECFRAVKRVLADSGTVWCNLGDSYAGSGKGPSNRLQSKASQIGNKNVGFNARWSNGVWAEGGKQDHQQPPRGEVPGFKAKDLMMMPSRVAMALQADGWWLRSMIPWLKRNAMPESVSDRPATSVEYVFLLSKSAQYYFDADAVRQPNTDRTIHAGAYDEDGRRGYPDNRTVTATDLRVKELTGNMRPGRGMSINPRGRNRRNGDWFFESWQGLLLDEDDAPLALVVNPAPFSASRLEHAYGDGRHRTTSPDCPIHGVPTELADDRADGGLPDASRSARSPHTDGRPAQSLASELPATRTDPAASLVDSPTATGRSKRTSKTDSRLGAPSGAGGAMFSDTEYSGVRPASPATYDRTPESSNGPDDSTAHPSEQTPGRTAHTGALEQESELGVNASGECYSESNNTGAASDSDRVTQSPPRNDHKCSCHIVDHYAVFPPKLVEPMVKASTSEKGQCPECGAPWVRVVETELVPASAKAHKTFIPTPRTRAADENDQGSNHARDGHKAGWVNNVTTTGWRPSCAHVDLTPVPQTILDCFSGSGTTLMVADRLGRNAIGCELSESYSDMGTDRIVGDAPMFVELAQ